MEGCCARSAHAACRVHAGALWGGSTGGVAGPSSVAGALLPKAPAHQAAAPHGQQGSLSKRWRLTKLHGSGVLLNVHTHRRRCTDADCALRCIDGRPTAGHVGRRQQVCACGCGGGARCIKGQPRPSCPLALRSGKPEAGARRKQGATKTRRRCLHAAAALTLHAAHHCIQVVQHAIRPPAGALGVEVGAARQAN